MQKINIMSNSFWSSSHKMLYLYLAIRYRVTPVRVYKLAHGKNPRTHKDKEVVRKLVDKGIVYRRRRED